MRRIRCLKCQRTAGSRCETTRTLFKFWNYFIDLSKVNFEKSCMFNSTIGARQRFVVLLFVQCVRSELLSFSSSPFDDSSLSTEFCCKCRFSNTASAKIMFICFLFFTHREYCFKWRNWIDGEGINKRDLQTCFFRRFPFVFFLFLILYHDHWTNFFTFVLWIG